jgi:ABC-2 type transport system permease protein
MSHWFSLFRREWSSYFSSGMGYLILGGFLFLGGILSWFCILNDTKPSMRYFFDFSAFLLMIIAPLLTMRSFAEERRVGTLEMLMTTPIRERDLVLGKFFAALSFYLVLLAPSLSYYGLLHYYSEPDVGAILAGYFGNILLASLYVSLGLFCSVCTSSQILSALGSFFLIFALQFVALFENTILSVYEDIVFWLQQQTSSEALQTFLQGTLELMDSALKAVSVSWHLRPFHQGILDTRNLFYFVSLTFFLLFLTTIILERQRWRKS